jgi:hypothetical protein
LSNNFISEEKFEMKFSAIILGVTLIASNGLALAHQDNWNSPKREYWQERWSLHSHNAPIWAFKTPWRYEDRDHHRHQEWDKPRRHEYRDHRRHHDW